MAAPEARETPAPRIAGATFFALQGPLIWALHFAIVYPVHHLACRAGTEPGAVIAVIAAATLGAIAALATAAVWSARWVRLELGAGDALWRFLSALMRWLAVISGAGIVWAGAALAFVAACAR